MTFQDSEVRDRFHKLPTALQHNLVSADERLSKSGQFVHIEDVIGESEVVIRISRKYISSIREA